MERRLRDNVPRAADMLTYLDKKVMILLRDGRSLIGFLRTCDQFVNLVIDQSVERIHVNDKYSDIYMGTIVIRGENVVLCGEVDLEKEVSSPLEKVPLEEIFDLKDDEAADEARIYRERQKAREGFVIGNLLDFLDDF